MAHIPLAVAAVCTLSACGGTEPPLLPANFSPAPTDDGRPGYVLYLPKDTWAFVSRHDGITEAELNQRIHAQVQFMVDTAMEKQHGACGHSWLFSSATNTPDGGVAFGLFCATPAEVKAFADKQKAGEVFKVAI